MEGGTGHSTEARAGLAGPQADVPKVPSPTPSGRGPIPSLDGLRALAVLIVVVSHAGYGETVPGGLGVTIFFFLSGYLITTLILDEQGRHGTINVPHFYLRRAFRLLPPLFVTLAIAYSLVAVGWLDGGFSWQGLGSQIFYFANYYTIFIDEGGTTPAGTGILWSLAVEEHFYIVFPVLMFIMMRFANARRLLIGLFVGLCILALAWRVWLVSRPGFVEIRTYYSTDTRFDSILFGCLLALWRNPARLPVAATAAAHAWPRLAPVRRGRRAAPVDHPVPGPGVQGVAPLHPARHRPDAALLLRDQEPDGGSDEGAERPLAGAHRCAVLRHLPDPPDRPRGPRGEPGHRPAQSGCGSVLLCSLRSASPRCSIDSSIRISGGAGRRCTEQRRRWWNVDLLDP